jgi:hypothetical protein
MVDNPGELGRCIPHQARRTDAGGTRWQFNWAATTGAVKAIVRGLNE